MNTHEKFREALWVISTIAIAAAVANVAGCGSSSSNGNTGGSETTEQQTCLSNIRQLGTALIQYEQDNDEVMPPPVHGGPAAWAGRMYPYFHGTTAILACPEDPTSPGTGLTPNSVTVSYGLNSNCQSGTGLALSTASIIAPSKSVSFFEVLGDQAQVSLWDEGSIGYQGIPPTQLTSPAGDGLTESPEYGYRDGFAGLGTNPLRYATGAMGGRPLVSDLARHLGGANYGALDGHAIFLTPSQVSSGTNNPSATGAQDTPLNAAAGPNASGFTLTFSVR